MASFRQRGKKKTWDYRIFNNKGEVIHSNSGFKTKKEAVFEATAMEQKLQRGLTINDSLTLYELWKMWYELEIEPSDLREQTKLKYLYKGKAVKSYFGNQRISSIKSSDYQKFINDYGSRVTRDEVSRLNSIVKKVLQMAKRDGLIFVDFTEGVKLVGLKKRKLVSDKYINSIESYQAILAYLKDNFNYKNSVSPFLLYYLFKTGLRVGEGMSTRWSDIDFEQKLGYTKDRFSGDRQEFCPPKTETSIRYYPLSDDLIEMLKVLKKEQDYLLKLKRIENPDDLVFWGWKSGVPTNAGLNKYLRNCLNELGIYTKLSCTGTRHTYASYLLSQGVDIWVISKILGHKDVKQLMETYGHLLKEKQDSEFELTRVLIDK